METIRLNSLVSLEVRADSPIILTVGLASLVEREKRNFSLIEKTILLFSEVNTG